MRRNRQLSNERVGRPKRLGLRAHSHPSMGNLKKMHVCVRLTNILLTTSTSSSETLTMKPKPASSSASEIKALQKQVTALQKEVGKLQKAVHAATNPQRLRATRAVVESLQVVDSSGKLVAEIDNKGNLFCRTVWASTGKNTRGVFIDGVTFRSVSAGKLELIGTKGNTPAVEINGWGSAGDVKVRDTKSKQQVWLQGSGSALYAYDDQGNPTVRISAHIPAGGEVLLSGKGATAKAIAKLWVHHLTNAGAVSLVDSKGDEVAHLP